MHDLRWHRNTAYFAGNMRRYQFWEFLCSLRGYDDLPTVIAESALDYPPIDTRTDSLQ